MDGDGRVRVFARVRPTSRWEDEADVGGVQAVELVESCKAVHVWDGGAVQLQERAPVTDTGLPSPRLLGSAREFIFDGVFPAHAGQEEIFEKVGLPVLRACMAGINGTIFAYGQTGSGKTHSLLHPGPPTDEIGLLPRLCARLFDFIAIEQLQIEVEAAAVQVYSEQVDDILHPDHQAGVGLNLAVQDGGVVPGLTWWRCQSADQMLKAFSRARSNLVYAETQLNKASSRSHAIFQIKLTSKHEESNTEIECVTCARLSVIDLSGSERVKRSGVEGLHLREATAINRSLLALGCVISALAAKRAHVPFRDSKLTRVLDGLIGGNCKTVLLVCASPNWDNVHETLCSLEFASRAMCVEVNARVNKVMIELDGRTIRGRRARPPSAPPTSARKTSADSVQERNNMLLEVIERLQKEKNERTLEAKRCQQTLGEVELRCRLWKERVETLERERTSIEGEAKQLYQAVAQAEKRAAEWRAAADLRLEEVEIARKVASDEAARATGAEERNLAAIANLESVGREAAEREVHAKEHAQHVESELEAVRKRMAEEKDLALKREAADKQHAEEALQASAAEVEAIRKERDAAKARIDTLEAEVSQCRRELQSSNAALSEAKDSFTQLQEEADGREAALQKNLIEAFHLAEDATQRLKAEEQRVRNAEAELCKERSQNGALSVALEVNAARDAEHWAEERAGLEAAHMHLVDAHRADFGARLRSARGDLESRLCELKRERTFLRRKLEEQRNEHSQAEIRWRQAKDEALREERERAIEQQRRSQATIKTERAMAAAREAELREANMKLTKRFAERESREEDLQQILELQAHVKELQWDAQKRSREIETIRRDMEQQEKIVGIRGFAPPLPARKRPLALAGPQDPSVGSEAPLSERALVASAPASRPSSARSRKEAVYPVSFPHGSAPAPAQGAQGAPCGTGAPYVQPGGAPQGGALQHRGRAGASGGPASGSARRAYSLQAPPSGERAAERTPVERPQPFLSRPDAGNVGTGNVGAASSAAPPASAFATAGSTLLALPSPVRSQSHCAH